MSNQGYVFSYAIGLIFLIGGILFMVMLDEHRFLFGIPYTAMGLLIVVGLHEGRKRRLRREAREAALLGEDADLEDS
ncbi:MAG: hypothetical protein H6531_00080 [Actinobacteria bacterium]|nr:hypothetical protein [Thermoleophilia bacterium]MCB9010212.1 hypothetical protein [Actinomycetota bacterium]